MLPRRLQWHAMTKALNVADHSPGGHASCAFGHRQWQIGSNVYFHTWGLEAIGAEY